MDKLIVKGLKNIDGMKFHEIEGGFGENKKAMLVKEIAEIHGRDLKDINRNINNNIKRFINGVDILDLKVSELKSLSLELGYSNQSYANANNIYLLSERGYSKLLKILEDDVAWECYEKLVDGYFNMRAKESTLNTQNLSPELQMFNKMFQAVANVELSNKELKEEITSTNVKLDGIKDIVALNSTDWKKDTSNLISKMALKLGGFEHISDLRKESYNILNKRTGIKLETRLTNKRRRMADEGVCKSKRDKLNYIDIISEDKKELEVYLAIVKEMAIKYGV